MMLLLLPRTSTSLARFALIMILAATMTRVARFRASQKTFLPLLLNNDIVSETSSSTTIIAPKTTTAIHNPSRFQTSTQLNIDRGMHILNMWSAGNMATWIYRGAGMIYPRESKAWYYWTKTRTKFLENKLEHAAQIRVNDVIFVAFSRLQEFTSRFLPLIHADVVLITTAFGHMYPDWVHTVAPNITDHPHIVAWFATNIGNYTGGYQRHTKVHSFPLGLKPEVGPAPYRRPIPFYRQVFLQNYYNATKKTNTLFVSPVRDTNGDRNKIVPPPPQGIMGYTEYLQHIAASYYVFSPDGDHPDCHRHYESIGLGAVAVTQLDPDLYPHFGPPGRNIIYHNTEWNMTKLIHEQLAVPPSIAGTSVERNMVFEEYWMEYVETVVQRPLRWWDGTAQRPALLQDFVLSNTAPLYLLSEDPPIDMIANAVATSLPTTTTATTAPPVVATVNASTAATINASAATAISHNVNETLADHTTVVRM